MGRLGAGRLRLRGREGGGVGGKWAAEVVHY